MSYPARAEGLGKYDLEFLENFMRLILLDEFSFASMFKFQSLAQFPFDHLFRSVMPRLVLLLCPFAASAHYVIIGSIIFFENNLHLLFCGVSSIFALIMAFCPVGWGCRIQRLHLCRRVRPPNECLGYDSKQSNGEVPGMLGLRGMRNTPSMPLLPGPLWPGVVAPDRALSIG